MGIPPVVRAYWFGAGTVGTTEQATLSSQVDVIPKPHLRMPTRLLLAALTLCVASALHAQATDTTTRSTTPKPRKTIVSINPFAVFALYFAGDVETVVSPTATVGAGISHSRVDDYNKSTALEVKARYYPSEKALEGFSIAATAGFALGPTDRFR